MDKETFILSIEASQKVCSVAIHKNGVLLANSNLFSDKSASSLLTPLIEQLLNNCQLAPTEVAAVAVAMGPGSYTGLRIAVSTAKGLCMAIDKPLIAINTLEAMARQVAPFFTNDYVLCPMLDARRMEVYCAVYDTDLQNIETTNAKILDENSFSELLATKYVVFFGDGADKCKELFKNSTKAVFLKADIFPNANTVGSLAFKKFEEGKFENLVTFEPFYLKDFVGTKPK